MSGALPQSPPASNSGASVTVPPSTAPQLAAQHPPHASSSVYGPLAAALVGALVAQGIAAWVNYRLRSRAEQVEAFDRVFTKGMAARRAMSRHRANVGQQVEGSAEKLADAITEFRAAELAYQAQFGGSDAASSALRDAKEAVEQWPRPEISDAEMEELADKHLQETAGEPQWAHNLSYEWQSREDLRLGGLELEEKLNEAMTAFGQQMRRRRRWRRK